MTTTTPAADDNARIIALCDSVADLMTAAHDAPADRRPTWATEDHVVSVDRDDRDHPDDHGVHYARPVDRWQSTRSCLGLKAEDVRVLLRAFRHDNGQDDEVDTVEVWVQGVAQLDEITAVDARRLGVALLRAADLIEERLDPTIVTSREQLTRVLARVLADDA